jgi:hypothetical protein
MSRLPVVVLALSACITGLTAQSRYAVLREETVSRTLRAGPVPHGVEGPGLLEVSTISGSIRVAGHDDGQVDVVVRLTVRR